MYFSPDVSTAAAFGSDVAGANVTGASTPENRIASTPVNSARRARIGGGVRPLRRERCTPQDTRNRVNLHHVRGLLARSLAGKVAFDRRDDFGCGGFRRRTESHDVTFGCHEELFEVPANVAGHSALVFCLDEFFVQR